MTHALQQLRSNCNWEALAWLQHAVLAVLHAPCAVGTAIPQSARSHAVSNHPLRLSAWPGSDFGVRAPDSTETALSWDEVEHGCVHGLFEGWDDCLGTQGVRGQV